jgi:hypothetical protein
LMILETGATYGFRLGAWRNPIKFQQNTLPFKAGMSARQ